jgi:hypothetical protein
MYGSYLLYLYKKLRDSLGCPSFLVLELLVSRYQRYDPARALLWTTVYILSVRYAMDGKHQ